MAIEKTFAEHQLRKRVHIQRFMTERKWNEGIMQCVFYGEDYLIDFVGVWLSTVGEKRTRAYLERRFLGEGMIDLNKYNKLKKEAEETKSKIERAKGAYDLLKLRLQDEFDCKSEEDGEVLLKKLTEEVDELQDDFDKAYEGFKVKWGESF